jgi:DNA-binding CsgD family transcriptional regulator/PAS domain-containing protein
MVAKISLTDYDSVVSDIYDAALSPAHWDVALTNLVNRFGQDRWDVAMLLWEQIEPPGGRFLGASGLHVIARQGYAHSFAGANPWSINGHGLPVGSVVHSDQLIAREDFRETPFFRDFLTLFNMEVGVLALLDRHGPSHLALCLPGPDTGSTERMETAVKLLLPHIQRAGRIARRIGEAEISARSAKAVLDAAPSAILMCDAVLRLSYANPLGEALLRDGYFALRDGRLSLGDAKQGQRLLQLAGESGPQRCAAFAFENAGMPPIAAMAMRIDDEPANPDFGNARVMIVAGRNHRASFANVDHLRDWFGLTPAEARLAATLAEGGSLDDFAATRGITLNAARFLLKGVFTKTDTNRQPQLVARLQATPLQWHVNEVTAELPSPIAGA